MPLLEQHQRRDSTDSVAWRRVRILVDVELGDSDPAVHRAAFEGPADDPPCTDQVDNNCNGYIDGDEPDKDGDGFENKFDRCPEEAEDFDGCVSVARRQVQEGSHVIAAAKSKHPKRKRPDPIIWVRRYGNGRVYCNTFGHDDKALTHPQFLRLMARGLLWSAGRFEPTGNSTGEPK